MCAAIARASTRSSVLAALLRTRLSQQGRDGGVYPAQFNHRAGKALGIVPLK